MDYMMKALDLAALARGQTSPNPLVGAILVKDGQIVGTGYHRKAGRPHAEVFALREAGEEARGAALYVTLEPCCHFGRTPPCTRAIIEAGVAEVHAAMLDPNVLMSGNGLAELKRAGIRTVLGEHEGEARRLNEAFVTYITKQRPFVIVKYAMSLDGKIATAGGESRGLTGDAWLREMHRLRGEVDAILVGVNTVLADDPLLTVRTGGDDVRQPLRVVLDSTLRTPPTARMLAASNPGKTLIAATLRASQVKIDALRERGVEVVILGDERVDISALLQLLGARQIGSLLVEGGGQVIASFIEADLVDKVIAVVAPLFIGGSAAPTPFAGKGFAAVAEALHLDRVAVRTVGQEIVITGYPVLAASVQNSGEG